MARSRARVPVTRKRRSPARHDPDAGTRRGDEAQTPPSGPRPNREKGFAPDIMLSDLPVTAQNILAAARHILERDGFRGLTYEAIAAESGEYKDSVRYHFGGKAGLLAALVDATTHDASLQIYAQGRGLKKPADRLRAVIQASRSLPGSESYAVMWELSPQILRDRALRNRVAQLYEWYRGHYVELLEGETDPATRPDAQAYAALLLAMLDGLAFQKALDPDGVDLDRVFALWSDLVTSSLTPDPHGERRAVPGEERPAPLSVGPTSAE